MASIPPQRPRILTSPAHLSVSRHTSALPSPAVSPRSSPPPLPSASSPLAARPSMSRTHSQSLSISRALPASKSLPPGSQTPFFLSPQPSTVNVLQNASATPRRLLLPTTRHTRHSALSPSPSPKIPSQKYPQPKLSRSRAGSVTPSVSPDLNSHPACDDWIGGGCKFQVVAENIQLEGYQIYAVEKWVVERRRPITTLTVFTGDPRHRVSVTALSPLSSLSSSEAQTEWEKALYHLRRDGARPRDTDHGLVMVTSLANFRSDFTIVHIPRGSFLDVREQLYTNINILRTGCSGRSALTLEEPSDTTKDRFISMYHLSDKLLARSQDVFNPTVIELIKLIQASLSICGMFPLTPDGRNGLLCDVTLEGIQRWVNEIGEPCVEMEPLERTLDPAVVAALFSTILTVRNKLQALGHPVPKDPFIDPASFIKSLYSFQNSLKPGSHSHSLSLTHHSSHSTPIPPSTSTLLSNFTSPPSGASASNTTVSTAVCAANRIYLTQPLIVAIQSAYDKLKQSESYKVHRVLINKLDDLATDLRTEGRGGGGWWQGNNVFNNNQPLTDLAAFAKCVVGNGGGGGGWSSRDGASSLRYLWSGRPEEVGRKRREKEAADNADGNEEDGKFEKDKDKDRDKDKEKEGKERFSYDREKEVKSSEDEGELGLSKPWSGRVQRKIEVWAALGRAKKLSADFGARGRAFLSTESPPRATQSTTHLLPSVVISRDPADEDDVLSSGQTSPVSDSHQRNPLMLGLGAYSSAQRSATELSEYDRRVTEFDQRRPPTKAQYQTRIISWSDPVTARGLLDEGETRRKLGASPLGREDGEAEETQSTLIEDVEGWSDTQRMRTILLKKRRSFDDADKLRGTRILPVDRMKIDVELCGQLLIMRRREEHMANVIACLQAFTKTLSTTNASLRNNYTNHQPILAGVESRTAVLQQVEAARTKAEAMSQETQALAYESAQFMIDDLWHMASQPRQKVLDLREKVFGTGRRRVLPQGVRGAHGRFNRVQTMLDGREVLVDALGRTESEAEEEEALALAGTMEREKDREMVEEEDVDADVVEHQNLRPTWLLRFFNYWGSRWGPRTRSGSSHSKTGENGEVAATEDGHTNEGGGDMHRSEQKERDREKALSTSVDAWREISSRRATAAKKTNTT